MLTFGEAQLQKENGFYIQVNSSSNFRYFKEYDCTNQTLFFFTCTCFDS